MVVEVVIIICSRNIVVICFNRNMKVEKENESEEI